MDRRTFLTSCCFALSTAAAGCSGPTAGTTDQSDSTTEPAGSETEQTTVTQTATDSSANTAADPVDDIVLEVVNARAASVTVTLTITTDGERFFERTVTLEPDERTSVDPGIDTVGSYELTVSLASGDEHVRPFSVEDYDLGMGSNLIVNIGAEIRVLMEE